MARNLGIAGQRKKVKPEEVALPIKVTIQGGIVGTRRNDSGGKTLVVMHPASGQEFEIPMNRQANYELANQLIEGGFDLATADEMPPEAA